MLLFFCSEIVFVDCPGQPKRVSQNYAFWSTLSYRFILNADKAVIPLSMSIQALEDRLKRNNLSVLILQQLLLVLSQRPALPLREQELLPALLL